MKGLYIVSIILVIVGALNWGLVGFFSFDLVANIFGGGDAGALLPRIVYAIVGIAGVIVAIKKIGRKGCDCANCQSHAGSSSM